MACKIYETLLNTDQPVLLGTVVRMDGDDAFHEARADSIPNVQGTVGVTLSAIPVDQKGPVLTNGKGTVLLQTGLVAPAPAAGQTLWVSETFTGRATNVKPAIAVIVGIIKNASAYDPVAPNSTVEADVDVDENVGGVQRIITLSASELPSAPVSTGAGPASLTLMYEWSVDFSRFQGPLVGVQFNFLGAAGSDGDTFTVPPNFQIRIGGTVGSETTGTLVGSPVDVTNDPTTFVQYASSFTFLKSLTTTDKTLVKIVGRGGTDALLAAVSGHIRGVSVQFTS